MRIAALQTVSTPRVEDNLAAARRLVAQAAAAGAELVALPEYFCLMGHRDSDKRAIAERVGDGPIQATLAALAREYQVWLVGGTVPLKGVLKTGSVAGGEKVSNSVLVYSPDGQLVTRYDKIHLFKFDDGRQRYDEAETLVAGRSPIRFTMNDRSGRAWTVGLSVCYDLRFPELYRQLMDGAGCELLLVPAAFTHTTGLAHWELLLRARAVENQVYVMAPAQGGMHENGRRTFGHSMVVDPWGEVLACRAEGEGIVVSDIDPEKIADVRTRLPALSHRVLGRR